MPAYNAELFIAASIESIINQTYSNWELLIIDDGSTDKTSMILQSYKQDRIVVIRNNSNIGLNHSLNKGIKKAKGKYLARIDADDICHPERLAKQVGFMESHPDCVLCGSGVVNINEAGEEYGQMKRMPAGSVEIKAALFFSCPFIHPTVMFRRAVLMQQNLQYNTEVRQAEDYILYTELCRIGSFANLPESLTKYRIHQTINRITHDRNNPEILAGRMVAWRKILAFFDLNANDETLLVHDKITYYADRITTADATYFGSYIKLLVQMLKANKQLGVFHQRYFHQQVAARLYITLLHPMFAADKAYGWFLRHGHLLRLNDWLKFPAYKLRSSRKPSPR